MSALLDKTKRIHFVGIGGIGMSGIASVLLEKGYKVSGSDLEMNNLTQKIEESGGSVFKGHRPSNIPKDTGLLVYSASIPKENSEVLEAKRKFIPIVHRARVLAELFNKKRGIAVTGTHGKTTTTSLVSVMLENASFDPTAIIGGEVKRFDGNSKSGRGEYLVAEADESDSSFLYLKPFYTVITNIELEHLDHYKTLDDANEAYKAFANNLKKGGAVFYNKEDKNLKEILKDFRGRSESFGFTRAADIYASDIKMEGFKASFQCAYKNKRLGQVSLAIPGRHNILNALAAILVGLNLEIPFEKIKESIRDFDGAKRRFHLRAHCGGVMLIDDYAHHPTEIRTVLAACRNWKYKRLIAIFQPHRYTRTKALAEDFGRCFKGADKLILTDIYAASEEPIKGVTIKSLRDKVKKNSLDDIVILRKDDIADYVMDIKKPGDMILVLGAGDIKKVADSLSKKLKTAFFADFTRSGYGTVKFAEPLSARTSFKIGGPAEIWAEPANDKGLKNILAFARGNRMPVFIMGNGSNLLVGDKGFKGVIISLNAAFFKNVRIRDKTVSVGAGFSLARLISLCCGRGLVGLESLVGIPGTVGGAIFMNAGGSANPIFKNIGDFVQSLKVMDREGKIMNLRRDEIEFGYRSSSLDGCIILEGALKLRAGARKELLSRCSKFLKMKREKQVLDMPSAGCIFKNPVDFHFTCGQMIDMLGLKGKRLGGAEVSIKHANFIVNRGKATCGDVLKLIDFIKNKVKENYGVDLELEVKVI